MLRLADNNIGNVHDGWIVKANGVPCHMCPKGGLEPLLPP